MPLINIAALISLTTLVTFSFWKISKLLMLTPLIFLLSLPMAILIPHDPCESISYNYSSLFSILSFLFAMYISAIALSSVAFIVGGIFLWIRFRKDTLRTQEARRLVFSGLLTFALTIGVFIIVNIIINAIGLGTATSLCIPTLKDFQE